MWTVDRDANSAYTLAAQPDVLAAVARIRQLGFAVGPGDHVEIAEIVR